MNVKASARERFGMTSPGIARFVSLVALLAVTVVPVVADAQGRGGRRPPPRPSAATSTTHTSVRTHGGDRRSTPTVTTVLARALSVPIVAGASAGGIRRLPGVQRLPSS